MWKKLLTAAAGIGVLVSISGCIEATALVAVKKDGSGTVTETLFLSPAMQQMIQGMQAMAANQGGGQTQAQVQANPLLDEAAAKAKAEKMGKGVRYVASKEVTKPDGTKGVKVLYEFDDVSTLRLTASPGDQMGGGMGMGGGPGGGMGGGMAAGGDKPVTFGFVKGPKPKLTVHLPHKQAAAEQLAKQGAGGDGNKIPGPQEMMMMKQMFQGFRFRLLLKVDGEITDTNATYTHVSHKTGKRFGITLMDLNLGELVNDEAGLQKLMAMQQATDVDAAMKALKDIPGIKVEPSETVQVAFE